MPMYSYACERCGFSALEARAVSVRDICPECVRCSQPMSRVFEPPRAVIRSQNDALTVEQMKELRMFDGAVAHKNWLETPAVQTRIREGKMEVETKGPKELIPSLPSSGKFI